MISPEQDDDGPLNDLDEWEDDLLRRYPAPTENDSRFSVYRSQ